MYRIRNINTKQTSKDVYVCSHFTCYISANISHTSPNIFEMSQSDLNASMMMFPHICNDRYVHVYSDIESSLNRVAFIYNLIQWPTFSSYDQQLYWTLGTISDLYSQQIKVVTNLSLNWEGSAEWRMREAGEQREKPLWMIPRRCRRLKIPYKCRQIMHKNGWGL